METYTFMRELADSWVLLLMFAFFVGVGIWAFWPSQKKNRDDAAMIPFRDAATNCAGHCSACACTTDFLKEANHG